MKNLLNLVKTALGKSLPNNIEPKVVHTGTKLASNFQIKGKTKFDQKHDLVIMLP